MSEYKEGRELDALIAEKVMGFRVERITPEWYGREVTLFYAPGETLVTYSYDTNACNAMMFRNGVDKSNGIAPSVPLYSEEISDAWQVVEKLDSLGFFFSLDRLYGQEDHRFWRAETYARDTDGGHQPGEWEDADSAPLAICLVALQSVSGTEGEKNDAM